MIALIGRQAMPGSSKMEGRLSRRAFLAAAAATATVAAWDGAQAQSPSVDNVPIIDSHIHLFDGTRTVGAGYMGSPQYRAISKTSLPSMYSPKARAAGIVGAIVVESSGFIDDNLWYLEVCGADPFMVGVSGSLDPGQSYFGQYLARFHKDPLYRAIRSSRFYIPAKGTADNGNVALNPVHVDNLKLLAQADLALDTANPSMDLMYANAMLADAIPSLRIIMDHLPRYDPEPAEQQAFEAVVKEMAARPNIFLKITEVYHPRLTDGVIVKDYEKLRARVEWMYDLFGEDRVIFGTDYPESYGVATIPEEAGLMKRFFSTKSRAAAEKYFWKNSAHVYKWTKRAPDQPSLTS
jgi:predicted TIM-barrel fold metal-dependent hydrolase